MDATTLAPPAGCDGELILEQVRKTIYPAPSPAPPESPFPWLEREFFENQEKVKPEDLVSYAGQHIA